MLKDIYSYTTNIHKLAAFIIFAHQSSLISAYLSYHTTLDLFIIIAF